MMKRIQIRTEISGDVSPHTTVTHVDGCVVYDAEVTVPAGAKEMTVPVAISKTAKLIHLMADQELILRAGQGDKRDTVTVSEDRPVLWVAGDPARPFSHGAAALAVTNPSDSPAVLTVQVMSG